MWGKDSAQYKTQFYWVEGWLVKCRDFILERLTSLDMNNTFFKKDTSFMAHVLSLSIRLEKL